MTKRAITRVLPPSHRATWAQSSPAFCALCTSDTGPFVQRPFGKADALVTVCKSCDEEHPRQGNYSFGDGVGARETPRLNGHRVRGRRAG